MREIDKDTARNAAKINSETKRDEFFKYALYRGAKWTLNKSIIIHPIEMPTGKISIALLITEDTTIRQIEKSWREIIKWRDLLMEWQGASPDAERNFIASLQENLSNAHEQGWSYLKLAQRINKRITELLTEYAEWLCDSAEYREWLESSFESSLSSNPAESKKRPKRDMSSWQRDYFAQPDHKDPASLYWAKLIVRFCRPRLIEQDINELLQDALVSIQNGRKPFPPNEPVRGKDIRERIDYWRGKQKDVGNIS